MTRQVGAGLQLRVYRARELRSRDPLSRRLVDGGEVATATMDLIGLPVRSPLAAM
jgi:hypothetical protein